MSDSAVVLRYTPRYGGYWWQWGRESFWDKNRCLRAWATPEAAREWLVQNWPQLQEATGEESEHGCYR